MNEFLRARLHLTILYTLVLFLLTTAISFSYYARTSRIIDFQYHRIEMRLEENPPALLEGRPNLRNDIIKHQLNETKSQMVEQLILINALVLILGAILSYLLSGKTLRPIQKSMMSQQRFITDAAHELKTPITALRTSLEVSLMDKSFDKKTVKILKDNLKAATNLESLTESLLTLSRVNETKEMEKSPVEIIQVIKIAKDRTQPLAKKKNISVSTNRFDSQITVNGDENSLVEVIVILLDNAIKFSPKESTIRIKVMRQRRKIFISITDEGPGIDKENHERVFERFYREDKARKAGSYGLGLAVAKEIIEGHGGRIWVEGDKKGSVFKISLST